MNQSEFLLRYEEEKPIFLAWGNYLADTIKNAIEQVGLVPSVFLKIPVEARIKENTSIIAKAFLRKEKHYTDPYAQITDKVGIRFVVLELSEIQIVKDIIASRDDWECSKDVDFESNRMDKPELFEYQSVHYIARNCNIVEYNGVTIPANTPCEIQIRTLLQHAYAELSHQTVYKNSSQIDTSVKRKLARSMALIESTDELFKEVSHEMRVVDQLYLSFIKAAQKLNGFPHYIDTLNASIFDAYKCIIEKANISPDAVDTFISEKSYICTKVEQNIWADILFEQPIIYLLYYLVAKHSSTAQALWPFDVSYIEPIYSDLGISME